tara:strand:- start:2772 stop:3818 length:1047 start_codon:yes stop_codon:yes gene_type:complete
MAGLVRYNNNDIVNDTQKVVTSTWTNNTNNLQTAHTTSAAEGGSDFSSPTSSGAFYVDVHNLITTDTSAVAQYSLSYGHKAGSGSLDFTNDVGSYGQSATKCVYNQYRQLVYGDEDSYFKFDDFTPDDIYVININRARYKHNLKPGTLNLYISGSTSTTQNILRLTDDSLSKTGSSVMTNAGRQFNIVSGASGVMKGSVLGQTTSGSYGLFYPDAGFIVLNARAMSASLFSLAPTVTANTADASHGTKLIFRAISGAGYFVIDSEEKVSSQYYFTRARNDEFNYTTNPSFIDSGGTLTYSSMTDNPKTFITTVGMYNDNGDLVAVAKLSQPVSKDFTKEALIRVKLDY